MIRSPIFARKVTKETKMKPFVGFVSFCEMNFSYPLR